MTMALILIRDLHKLFNDYLPGDTSFVMSKIVHTCVNCVLEIKVTISNEIVDLELHIAFTV